MVLSEKRHADAEGATPSAGATQTNKQQAEE
eukprot:CAMPEP_0174717916 /NCGR_PEP_ID=MMETSP1094-20130205/27510_1 /TAXON_ID=156173 /ORGANISM="Chrysochromulina brevifilum, Strain UTEX LB 985" /LENGTH=30 /DNA_ID= /DNA_START= /DNA_END= /DNA_ORIENTATION=